MVFVSCNHNESKHPFCVYPRTCSSNLASNGPVEQARHLVLGIVVQHDRLRELLLVLARYKVLGTKTLDDRHTVLAQYQLKTEYR